MLGSRDETQLQGDELLKRSVDTPANGAGRFGEEEAIGSIQWRLVRAPLTVAAGWQVFGLVVVRS
jgi:hypothetical protein